MARYHAVVRARGDGRHVRSVGDQRQRRSEPDAGSTRSQPSRRATPRPRRSWTAWRGTCARLTPRRQRLYGTTTVTRTIRLLTGRGSTGLLARRRRGLRRRSSSELPPRFSWTARDGRRPCRIAPRGYPLRVKITDERGQQPHRSGVRSRCRRAADRADLADTRRWSGRPREAGPGRTIRVRRLRRGSADRCQRAVPGGLSLPAVQLRLRRRASLRSRAAWHRRRRVDALPRHRDRRADDDLGDTDIARFDELTVGPGDVVGRRRSWERRRPRSLPVPARRPEAGHLERVDCRGERLRHRDVHRGVPVLRAG